MGNDNGNLMLLIGLGVVAWFVMTQQKEDQQVKEQRIEKNDSNQGSVFTASVSDEDLQRIMNDLRNELKRKSYGREFVVDQGERWANKHVYWYYVKLRYLGFNDVQKPVPIPPSLDVYGNEELLTVDMVIDALMKDRVTPEKIKAQAKDIGIYSR